MFQHLKSIALGVVIGLLMIAIFIIMPVPFSVVWSAFFLLFVVLYLIAKNN